MTKDSPVTHDLYKTGDADAPEGITDRNGEVVLGCCRRCHGIEADLDGPCAASPVQAGIDPLVKKAIKQLWPNSLLGPKNLTELIVFIEEERECEAEYRRSQAERIAALEVERDDYKADYLRRHKDAVDHMTRAIVAESLLAEAREALERPLIYTVDGEMGEVHLTINGVKIGVFGANTQQTIALLKFDAELRATISRLKPGEKGGE